MGGRSTPAAKEQVARSHFGRRVLETGDEEVVEVVEVVQETPTEEVTVEPDASMEVSVEDESHILGAPDVDDADVELLLDKELALEKPRPLALKEFLRYELQRTGGPQQETINRIREAFS